MDILGLQRMALIAVFNQNGTDPSFKKLDPFCRRRIGFIADDTRRKHSPGQQDPWSHPSNRIHFNVRMKHPTGRQVGRQNCQAGRGKQLSRGIDWRQLLGRGSYSNNNLKNSLYQFFPREIRQFFARFQRSAARRPRQTPLPPVAATALRQQAICRAIHLSPAAPMTASPCEC